MAENAPRDRPFLVKFLYAYDYNASTIQHQLSFGGAWWVLTLALRSTYN